MALAQKWAKVPDSFPCGCRLYEYGYYPHPSMVRFLFLQDSDIGWADYARP